VIWLRLGSSRVPSSVRAVTAFRNVAHTEGLRCIATKRVLPTVNLSVARRTSVIRAKLPFRPV
jgi:hypothetical protein